MSIIAFYTFSHATSSLDAKEIEFSKPLTRVTQDSTYNYDFIKNNVLIYSISKETILPSWLHIVQSKVSTIKGDFSAPSGMVIDSKGNVFVADTNHNRILKITPKSKVSVFAGSGETGFNDATGTKASFSLPTALAIDKDDNIYVADTYNHKIRKITPSAQVQTLAGNNKAGSSNGIGPQTSFNHPTSLAVDKEGNIFIVDSDNNLIRKISTRGFVSTLAGSTKAGFKNGQGAKALFNKPSSIVIDKKSNLYVADTYNHRIRKVTPMGKVSTFAGNSRSGTLDARGRKATFMFPTALSIDEEQNIYVTDKYNHKIRKITPLGDVTTFSGTEESGFNNAGIKDSTYNTPHSLVFDKKGNIYISDKGNNVIRKMRAVAKLSGYAQYKYVGTHHVNLALKNEEGENFNQAFDIEVISTNSRPTASDIYFHINENELIDFTANDFNFSDKDASDSLQSITITTLPNLGKLTLNKETIQSNRKIKFDENSSIRFIPQVNTSGSVSFNFKVHDKLLASKVYTANIAIDAVEEEPQIISKPLLTIKQDEKYLYLPQAKDGDGDILSYSVNPNFPLPSWLTFKDRVVSSINTDTSINERNISFNRPLALSIANDNTLYIADTKNNMIRKITPDGNISIVAGSKRAGFKDNIGLLAQFDSPTALYLDKNSTIYVADSYNNVIRIISPDGNVSTLKVIDEHNTSNRIAATFNRPTGVTMDSKSNLYIADTYNNQIKKITPDGNLTVFAGSQTMGFKDAKGKKALFNTPYALGVDSHDNIIVADYLNHSIRKITPDAVVTTIAGNQRAGFKDGFGSDALFNRPTAISIGKEDTIYVADSYNNRIRKITPFGRVSTVVGSGKIGGLNDTALTSTFSNPKGVAVDSNNLIYIADSDNNQIRKVSMPQLFGTPNNDDIGEYLIHLHVSDNHSSPKEQNFRIIVENVNDAPTASNLALVIKENTMRAFKKEDFKFNDIDKGDTFDSLTITSLPQRGRLEYYGESVTNNQYISNISKLVYIADLHTSGKHYAKFKFKVSDGKALSKEEYTFKVSVTPLPKVIVDTNSTKALKPPKNQ